MDKVQSLMVFSGRTALSLGLGGAFSVAGIGVAWSLFVFSSSRSLDTMLWSLMVGAGLGAGLGGFLAWLRLEGDHLLLLLVAAALVAAAGIGGAWGGYEFGARQETECCAMPSVSPFTYTAVGSTVVASGTAMVFSLARDLMSWWWQTRVKNHAV
jgi:hypothetical protein